LPAVERDEERAAWEGGAYNSVLSERERLRLLLWRAKPSCLSISPVPGGRRRVEEEFKGVEGVTCLAGSGLAPASAGQGGSGRDGEERAEAKGFSPDGGEICGRPPPATAAMTACTKVTPNSRTSCLGGERDLGEWVLEQGLEPLPEPPLAPEPDSDLCFCLTWRFPPECDRARFLRLPVITKGPLSKAQTRR